MITYKIEGIKEMIDSIKSDSWIDGDRIDKVVQKASLEFKNYLKAAYTKHMVTGALVDSIETFRRTRKGVKDPFFTYYVGPRYTAGGKGLRVSYGGNAAHLLEYGTVDRYRANLKEGGVGKKQGFRQVYGAKISTGKMPAFGIIRTTVDKYGMSLQTQIGVNVVKELIDMSKNIAS